MYQLVFTRSATKSLRRMQRDIAKKIRKKLDALVRDPYSDKHKVRKLKGRAGFRLRAGDWRVIYAINNEKIEILVVKIAVRGEICK